ncbi:hypothetical protein [Methanoplanus limicola]|uniref:Transglutaminase domain-containing protein n=1 Tax=Methanoplanus limicola DSM 2279 TaxID=937775 RepID=H1Z4K0_9EURY|nr:hypothetical protein [Methanoplanus limicola]EHQ36748.1 hypothetical protein Metlim_2710 [Methanoplanus limicola DSM 2279]
MDSRRLDIIALISALAIVVAISFILNMPAGETTGSENKEDFTEIYAYVQEALHSIMPSDGSDEQGKATTDYSAGTTELSRYRSDTGFISASEKKEMNGRKVSWAMDYYTPSVRNAANRMIPEEHGGVFTIEQVCDIWDGLQEKWTKESSGGITDIQPASRTVHIGYSGDDADFAITMASFIKAIGGEARIRTAWSPELGEHTYAELFLGDNSILSRKVINNQKYAAFRANNSFIYDYDPSGLTVMRYRYSVIGVNNPPAEIGGVTGPDGNTASIPPDSTNNALFDLINVGADDTITAAVTTGTDTRDNDRPVEYSHPLLTIMNEPEKYGEICYRYPELINYLLLFPEINTADFELMYIQVRYGEKDENYHGDRDVRDVAYTYNYEKDGSKTYWMKMDYNGRYPGDVLYPDSGTSTVYYSDGTWDNLRVNDMPGPP